MFVYYWSVVPSCCFNILIFCVAATKHLVLCIIYFKASTLFGTSCAASEKLRGVEDLRWSGNFLSQSKRLLDFVQYVGLFVIVRRYTFDISQAYPAFCRIVEAGCTTDSGVRWSPYSAGDGIYFSTIQLQKSRSVQVFRWWSTIQVSRYR